METWICACCLSFILLVADRLSAQEVANHGNAQEVNTTHVTVTTGRPLTTNSSTTSHVQLSFFNNYKMLQRAFYVLIGISVLAVLYFVIRTCSMKKKPQRKKYGLLSDYDENMELGSMESDEEKIFESRNIRR
ncbi:protein FAM174C [Rana temporaria]|uniref:protein FAM174C n=1 Tax=Rana temporaria TaxID=8407 RepID=UPI001AAD72D1|nr:protein FAM174C [Rana temporaria]